MVVLLAIDLGRAYFTFVGVRNAAREAAIFGGYNPREGNSYSALTNCTNGTTYSGLKYTIAKEMGLGNPPNTSRVGCNTGGDVQILTSGAQPSGCYRFTAPATYVTCTDNPLLPTLTYVYRMHLVTQFQPVTPFVGLLTGNGFGATVPISVVTSSPVLSNYK
jgi:hypothetical protein